MSATLPNAAGLLKSVTPVVGKASGVLKADNVGGLARMFKGK